MNIHEVCKLLTQQVLQCFGMVGLSFGKYFVLQLPDHLDLDHRVGLLFLLQELNKRWTRYYQNCLVLPLKKNAGLVVIVIKIYIFIYIHIYILSPLTKVRCLIKLNQCHYIIIFLSRQCFFSNLSWIYREEQKDQLLPVIFLGISWHRTIIRKKYRLPTSFLLYRLVHNKKKIIMIKQNLQSAN